MCSKGVESPLILGNGLVGCSGGCLVIRCRRLWESIGRDGRLYWIQGRDRDVELCIGGAWQDTVGRLWEGMGGWIGYAWAAWGDLEVGTEWTLIAVSEWLTASNRRAREEKRRHKGALGHRITTGRCCDWVCS